MSGCKLSGDGCVGAREFHARRRSDHTRVRTTQAATGINITGANGNASEQSGMEDDRGGDDSCRGSALSSTSIWQGRLTIYPEATGV